MSRDDHASISDKVHPRVARWLLPSRRVLARVTSAAVPGTQCLDTGGAVSSFGRLSLHDHGAEMREREGGCAKCPILASTMDKQRRSRASLMSDIASGSEARCSSHTNPYSVCDKETSSPVQELLSGELACLVPRERSCLPCHCKSGESSQAPLPAQPRPLSVFEPKKGPPATALTARQQHRQKARYNTVAGCSFPPPNGPHIPPPSPCGAQAGKG